MRNTGGRPRSASVDDAVLDATIRLLGEHGYAGLRINDIATESKTAKTTIYRRWPSLVHLVVAAMEHALGSREIPSTGNMEADLDSLVEVGLSALIGNGSALLAVALDIHRQSDAALHSAYRQHIIDPLRERAISLLSEAMQRGELTPTEHPENLVDAVIGGLIYRAVVLAEPVSVEQAKDFWRDVLSPRRPHSCA